MTRLRTIDLLGTSWPVPEGWVEVEANVFQGTGGLLKLVVEDGELIDPARARTTGGALVRTPDRVAIRLLQEPQGMHVVVYATRSEALPDSDWSLPEVSASYVFTDPDLMTSIRNAIEVRGVLDEECGHLDVHGHLAMGPIPISASWRPTGDWVDNTGIDAVREPTLSLLVGGGWLDFIDQDRCCGVLLYPLAWSQFDTSRACELVARTASKKGLSASTGMSSASVWRYRICETGVSYELRDSSGRVRGLGAVWPDVLGQSWHLLYRFDGAHGEEHEAALRASPLS